MANPRQLKILKKGFWQWNDWRQSNRTIKVDLSNANLRGRDLLMVDLTAADLTGANLFDTDLRQAKLAAAELQFADLQYANLSEADLAGANLVGVDLSDAILDNASFIAANLNRASLVNARLGNANFSDAKVGRTIFAGVDLSGVRGLDALVHEGPSTIGLDTLYLSGGTKIPVEFLRGCGVPEDFITLIPLLFEKAIEFYSCFISYSTKDEDFARRLYSRLRDARLRVWFAPEDIKGGEKLHEQLERAIQLHDRLLIILSEHSMQSEWVTTELRKARKQEIREQRRKLFPIRLASFEEIQQWECFDADTGKDLAVEIREYFVPDFSNWKDQDSFEASFDRLLKDLRAAEIL